MRIAVVGNGASVHVAARSAAVAERGHEVRLVTLGPLVAPCPGVEVRTRDLPRTPWAALQAFRGFLRDLQDFDADLLHLHYAGGRLGTLATVSWARPLVVTVMGGDILPEQHLGGYSALERRATRLILEQADILLVKSDRLRNALRAFGDFDSKVEIVRWGVDPDRFRRDPTAATAICRSLVLPAGRRFVLSPRILAPLYAQHLLVQAWPDVIAREPMATLLLTEYAADAEYRRQLAKTVATLGLGNHVRFIGAVPAAEMPALYSLCDAVVMTPSSDGLPQSLFEALACETPVVLGRLPAYGEIVTGGESALFVDREPAAIAAAVAELLVDADLCRALAAAGRRRVLEVGSLLREVSRVLALYEALPTQTTRQPRRGALARGLDIAGLLLR